MKQRQSHARQAKAQSSVFTPELMAKRTEKHLDELERTNYVESSMPDDGEEAATTVHTKGRARQLISEKRTRNIAGLGKRNRKKSSMNVRSALLYRKTFATLLDEAHLPDSGPSYITAAAPPPAYPPRLLCSVCGYWGKYKCQRCALPYCDLNCEGVHLETRCERRLIA